jgi:hypothetical protein
MQNSRSGPVQRDDALLVQNFSKSSLPCRAGALTERRTMNLVRFAWRRLISLLLAALAAAANGGPGAPGSQPLVV